MCKTVSTYFVKTKMPCEGSFSKLINKRKCRAENVILSFYDIMQKFNK